MLSDRDRLLELVELFYGESLKDEEEICKLTQESLTTQDSLKSSQGALQESKMEIEQLHEKLQRSHLPSYTPFIHLHKVDYIIEHMEEYHEMVDHEMHFLFHVLENCANKLAQNQALDLFKKQMELFSGESVFSMEETDEITLVGSAINDY